MSPLVVAAVGGLPPTWASQTLVVLLLVLAAIGATAVACCRVPTRQAVLVSLYGMVLALTFLALQAPDVTLSEITIGAVVLPLLLLLTLSKLRQQARQAQPARQPHRQGRSS